MKTKEFITSYNTTSNDIAEYYNTTSCNQVECMPQLIFSMHFRAAVKIAIHLSNQYPRTYLKVTYQRKFVLANRPPMIIQASLVVKLFVHIRDKLRSKFDAESIHGQEDRYGQEDEMGNRPIA